MAPSVSAKDTLRRVGHVACSITPAAVWRERAPSLRAPQALIPRSPQKNACGRCPFASHRTPSRHAHARGRRLSCASRAQPRADRGRCAPVPAPRRSRFFSRCGEHMSRPCSAPAVLCRPCAGGKSCTHRATTLVAPSVRSPAAARSPRPLSVAGGDCSRRPDRRWRRSSAGLGP